MIDLLFPRYCVSCKKIGRYICDICFAKLSFSTKSMCLVCGKFAIEGLTHPACQTRLSIDGCFICYEYFFVIKKLVYVFKYKPYVSDMKKFLGDLMYEAVIQKESCMRSLQLPNTVIIPIPLHHKKMRKRGYNHAAFLGKGLANRVHTPFIDSILIRIKETNVQAGLNKLQRKENIKNAFGLKVTASVQGKTIFLVDDIVTTGTTFLEAALVLKKAGAKKVFGIAFAGEN